MKFFSIIFVTVVLCLGCNPSKTYEVPFTGAKIVINAVLKANETPEVYVGKTWGATGQVPENVHIENATVLLFEGNQLIGEMIHQQKGIYTSPKYKLFPEKEYIIKVNAVGLPNAESSPVKVPASFPLQSIKLDKNTNVSSLNGQRANPALLTVVLREGPSEFLGIVAQTYTGGYINATNISPLETSITLGETTSSDCIYRSALFGDFQLKALLFKPTLFIYDTFCLRNSKTMNLVVETKGYVQKPNDFKEQDADEIRIQLVNCSSQYVEFTKKNKILEGLDYAFTEPTPTYSNVKGGYGVVVAINRLNRSIKF
jgi:hypothetical protein